ncbi:N-6 DNA methylase [Bacillus benzoevorans]|uniref:N-6 DNA methylase n=1 Tax=Bacillus benzoevorans TaxID=1456 RepID=UPI0035EBBA22
MAAVYRAYKTGDGNYKDLKGFCKVTTLEEVSKHDYKLTPGIYVGARDVEYGEFQFEEKIEELRIKLLEQFEESNRLQERIKEDLEGLY